MSLALARPPRDDPDDAAAAPSARAVVLRLASFTFAFGLLTHLLLVHSRPLLALWASRTDTPSQPLRNEAVLRMLRPGEAPLLVVGSSVVESDFDPERLARRFGVSALPLPLYGGRTVEMAMAAPLIVRARPRAVAVLVPTWALFDHVDWSDVRVYDPRVAWSLLTWRELLAQRRAHTSHLLGSLHFAVRHRHGLRRMAGEWVAGGGRVLPPARAALDRGERVAAVLEAAERGGRELACPTVNTRAVEEMARRLRAAGVRVVLLATPGRRRWDDDPAVARRFDQCLAGVAEGTGSVFVPRASLPPFSRADFRDREHMSEGGREKFTDAVGPALRAALAPGVNGAVQ